MQAMRRDAHIVIIGAGIGGLAASAALRRVGIETAIYEQAHAFARVGAGIQQSPNAMKVHRGLGIEAQLRDTAFTPATSLNRDAITGAVTNEHPLGAAAEARYGAPYLVMHRGDLHAALAAIVPADTIRMGRTLVRIASDGPKVVLAFADGHGEYWKWRGSLPPHTYFEDPSAVTDPTELADLKHLESTAPGND